MSHNDPGIRQSFTTRWWEIFYVRVIGFGFVYYVTVNFGVMLVTQPEGFSVIWPAVGVALAALLLIPQPEWPIFLTVIFVINLFSNLASDVPLAPSIGFALANTLEPALGGWLMNRRTSDRITFTRLGDVLSLIAVFVLVDGLGALLWALIPMLTFGASYITTWVSWWILDGMSMLIITPFIITWFTGGAVFSMKFLERKLETLIWLMILIVSTWLMFGAKKFDLYLDQNPYMLFPILIWVAFRFSPRASASALLLMGVVALYSATLTTGAFPVGGDSPREKLISIQAFLCIASVTTMILSTIVTERKQVFIDLNIQVTELEQAQTALRENQHFLNKIINTSPNLIYIYDLIEKRNVYANRETLEFLGYDLEKVKSGEDSLMANSIHPDDLAKITEHHRQFTTANDSDVLEIEYRLMDAHGNWRWMRSRDVLFARDSDGKAWQIIEITENITERKQAEIEREKLIIELSTKNAELERFTYTVSHDLKSPLVTIRGFLGYLTEDVLSGNTTRAEQDIKRITDATNKMQDLLRDLLELSRVGRVMNTPETIQFEELVHDAQNLVHGQLEARRIRIQTQSNLPAVHGDRQRLIEVLQNLLDNAIKYMGNQPDPYIEIGQRGEDSEHGYPVFFIKDNGVGIAPEYHDRIFGLFDKLDAKTEGTGIGLTIVKRIIEVHGGRIWVESESGKGSTFYFSLPTK